jgi:hypothetical protein
MMVVQADLPEVDRKALAKYLLSLKKSLSFFIEAMYHRFIGTTFIEFKSFFQRRTEKGFLQLHLLLLCNCLLTINVQAIILICRMQHLLV